MAIDNSVYNTKSRYTQGGETIQYEKRLGWWERDLNTLKEDDTDLFIKINPKYNKRPDKFAADYFGRSDMTWVVLQFNSIVDINEEFISGKTVRMPQPQRALFDFLNKGTGGVQPPTEE